MDHDSQSPGVAKTKAYSWPRDRGANCGLLVAASRDVLPRQQMPIAEQRRCLSGCFQVGWSDAWIFDDLAIGLDLPAFNRVVRHIVEPRERAD